MECTDSKGGQQGSSKEDKRREDARWQRAEASIIEAFGEAVASSPLAELSVTALAKQADISKAAFYLHYRSLDELCGAFAAHLADCVADELVTSPNPLADPEGFALRLISVLGKPAFHRYADVLAANNVAGPFIDRLTERIAAQVPEEDQLSTAFALSGLMGAHRQHPDCDPARLAQIFAAAVGAR
ncbi:MAG: TetR/AcrR family transcriptional regulator [Eggerthellaceae bacterium]|nr:TetR/AcrR family transcriptional regulator [Eggerthellaceae bacterium]